MFLKVVLVFHAIKLCKCKKFFHMFFKSSVGAIKLFKCKKKHTFGMRNTQYSIELSVHKQPSVFNTIYTIQCCVNCPKMRPNSKIKFIICVCTVQ